MVLQAVCSFPSNKPSHRARLSFEKIVIGNATLYRADCFDVLPELHGVDAAITDPPFGIGYKYRSHDDAPEKYVAMMQRLVPLLQRVTNNGPCFVWQSPGKADQWHSFFPQAFASSRLARNIRREPIPDRIACAGTR